MFSVGKYLHGCFGERVLRVTLDRFVYGYYSGIPWGFLYYMTPMSSFQYLRDFRRGFSVIREVMCLFGPGSLWSLFGALAASFVV